MKLAIENFIFGVIQWTLLVLASPPFLVLWLFQLWNRKEEK